MRIFIKWIAHTKEITQVTNARFGAFDPAVYGDTLYFSNYEEKGYEIWTVALDATFNKPVTFPAQPIHASQPDYYEEEVKQTVDANLHVEPQYNKFFWNRLFYTYGWFPLVVPPELGVEFNTLNLERSFKSTIGVNYNLNENIVQTRIQASYAKLFPIINGGLTIQARELAQPGEAYDPDNFIELRSREQIAGGGLEIPLRLTQGVYNTGLTLRGDYNFHTLDDLENGSDYRFRSLDLDFTFFRTRPAARRQVRTPFGQIIRGHFKNGMGDKTPKQLFLNGEFYFPGFSKTHSTNFRVSYENNGDAEEYRYLSIFRPSRGYQFYPFDQRYLLSANYEFPVFYPDFYIRAFVGVTRVRFNAFYDYTQGSNLNWDRFQRSYGAEVILDLRLLRAFNMDLKLQFIQRQDHFGDQKPFVFNIAVDYFELLN